MYYDIFILFIIMIAYDVLTNNDLLQYITQWHILLPQSNIVNALSQDKNIIKWRETRRRKDWMPF